MGEEIGSDAAMAATTAEIEGLERFEIKEYSVESESTTEEHLSAAMEDNSRSASKNPIEGAPDATAEEKSNKRNQMSGAKRGGRRFSEHRAMWSRLIGTGRNRHEIGDLVEAEWQGSGSWYVGHVEGQASIDGSRRSSNGMYHVVFADGDEADVHGKDLKQLGPTGHAKGSAGTLPRYVPVADVGSGRLHQKPTASSVSPEDNAEPKRGKKRGENVRRGNNRTEESASQQVGRLDSTEASETKKVVDHGDQNEQSPIFQSGEGRNTGEKGRELPAPLHRGSAGSLDDRRNQAEQALWGGRRVPTETHADNNNNNNRPVHASATGGGGAWNGGDDWWETGTQYAFQPRLVADKPTVRSLAGHYSGGGAAGRQVRKGGGGGGGRNEGSESKLPVRRVIQPAVGNSDRGQRVFFLA